MPDPCIPIARLASTSFHKIMHGLRHIHTNVVRHVGRGAIHGAHVGHLAAPVLDSACHQAARLVAIGMLALAPSPAAQPLLQRAPPAAMASGPVDWTGFGGGRGAPASIPRAGGSAIVFSLPDADPSPPAPPEIWRAYVRAHVSGPDGSGDPAARPIPALASAAPTGAMPLTVPLPEPDALPVFAAAAGIVCWLRMNIRASCRMRPSRV
jgi:hypothetical protein